MELSIYDLVKQMTVDDCVNYCLQKSNGDITITIHQLLQYNIDVIQKACLLKEADLINVNKDLAWRIYSAVSLRNIFSVIDYMA